MKSDSKQANLKLDDAFIDTVCRRLSAGERVRRSLPGWGRVHVDRPLPFLCIYRRPLDRPDEGTYRLVTSEGAYITATSERQQQRPLEQLVQRVAGTLVEAFGSAVILELWSEVPEETGRRSPTAPVPLSPRFQIAVPDDGELGSLVDDLASSLERLKIGRQPSAVEVVESDRCRPPGLPALITRSEARSLGCQLMGLEVRPVYRNQMTGPIYPLVLDEMRRKLTTSLRRFFYAFTRTRTTHQPAHYHVLGRRAVVKAVWEVDRRLAEVSNRFEFLLQVSPINVERAWQRFRKSRYQRAPVFHYRPLPLHPVTLKRALYRTPVERIEDPALAEVFQEKLDELDRQISMLHDLNTPRFMHGSVMVFGGVSDDLLELAKTILAEIPAPSRGGRGKSVDSAAFVAAAEREIAHYREQLPDFDARVELRGDVAGGVMVSRGRLLVDRSVAIPANRVEALLHHEIGTHLVTYYNGRAQPFRQLRNGLAGYQSLQEGIAVLSEYLVGGLTRDRLRMLAARVVAVRSLLDGASFVETFHRLREAHRFSSRRAFLIAMRIYRGGGFTKDAVYLRGLQELLGYLGKGGDIKPLFAGKMSTHHIPIIRELTWRGVLKDPPLRPRFLDHEDAAPRLERTRAGLEVLDLVKEARS